MGEPPDDVLIASIARGDREAFAELYRRYRTDVCRFAAHMCGSVTAAEDIVHEAFVAVIDGATRYRPGQTTARLWLLGIARNHARRAHSVRQMLSLPEDPGTGVAGLTVEVDPLGDIERRRHLDALRRAIVALPVRYREAIVLCDLHELSYADAAAALGCAIGTVRSRLHRGRALLSRRLCDRPAEGPCTSTRHEDHAMTCRRLTPDVIDFARGASLDRAREYVVVNHLRDCGVCAVLVEQQRAMSVALRRLASEVETPETRPREYFRLLSTFDAFQHRPHRRMTLSLGVSLAASVAIVAGLSLGWKSDAPAPPATGAQFVILPGASALPRFESGKVIRVEIPSPEGVIAADVLVGQDGLARAVRLVQ